MATFTIEFARGTLPGPQYEDYSVSVAVACNTTAIQTNIKFNNNTGDYVVGWNYTNTSFGLPAQNIRIESFTDEAMYKEISTGNEIPVPGYTGNTLKDISTGSNLTYPYITPITNLVNIQENLNNPELICPDDINYTAVRRRKIQYLIIDSGGNSGELRTATFQNTPQ